MDFIEYANSWAKSEVFQSRIMIGIGVLFLIALIAIIKSENILLRGSIVPLSILLVMLLGYGSYIMYSRPAHAEKSIALFKTSEKEAIEKEKIKHIKDNSYGRPFIKYLYPIMILVSVLVIMLFKNQHYQGMALGIIVLSVAMYIIDYGFVSRSDAFLEFLSKLPSN